MLKNVSVKTWHAGQDPAWVLAALTAVQHLGINYEPQADYGVHQMIQNQVIDSYSIVYRDNEMIAGGGTRPGVAVPGLGQCYQIAVRGFRQPQHSLRQDYFTLDTLVPQWVQAGRDLGYQHCVMTFNLHNERLMKNLDRNWHYPRTVQGPHEVNGVSQWIYLF